MDEKWFKAINRFAGRAAWIDAFMILLANKSRYVYFFVLIWLALQNRCSRKTAANAVRSAGAAMIVHLFINLFYYRPRPFVKRRVGILIPSKMNSSFPSKHTLLMFAVSTSVLLRERTIGCVMSVLSFMTGFSRIWTGHHYPSDIIGSALLGSFISAGVNKYPHCFSLIRCYIERALGIVPDNEQEGEEAVR